MAGLPNVGVIGAGTSGLAALRALRAGGFAVTAFEASDQVGGNWVFRNPSGLSSIYRSLRTITSREKMAFSDLPMPRTWPEFPHHSQVAAYLEAYADRFGLRESIAFETRVEQARRRAGGGWELALSTGEAHACDALVVANGHDAVPRLPEPPLPGSASFGGLQLHAHDYRGDDPWLFRDRAVVVVGLGNSAVDIAVDASETARRVILSTRRGAHVLPRRLLGRPIDALGASPRIPMRVRRRVLEALFAREVGSMEAFGLPRPDHRIGEAHPTISDELLPRLAAGRIEARPALEALGEATAQFADGSEAEADVVVYCTGYRVAFPFFDPALISAPGNDLPLFRRVFHPDIPDVAFIGLCQPLGPIAPISEAQAWWVAEYLAGSYALPPRERMREDMARERAAMFARYVPSERHTMQIDPDDYLLALRRERRRGARRARAARAARAWRLPRPVAAAAGAAATAVAQAAEPARRRPLPPRRRARR